MPCQAESVLEKSPLWLNTSSSCPILSLLMVHVPRVLVVMFAEVRRCSDCVVVEDSVIEFAAIKSMTVIAKHIEYKLL